MTTTTSAVTSSNSILSSYLATQAQQEAANTSSSSSSSGMTAAQQAAATAASVSATWGNFNTYLNILTTQLQNQDPTNATDPNQFTEELVQFAGVEQQLSTNSKLDTLINYAKNSSGSTAALSYMGQYAQVTTTSNQLALQSGSSEIGYTLASPASSAVVTVKDSSGNTVATLTGGAAQGANYVSWNGQDSYGNQLADGTYTFSISATNTDGTTATPSATYVIGKVTGVVSNSDGTTNLDIGNLSFASSAVDAVYSAGNLPAATTSSSSTSGS